MTYGEVFAAVEICSGKLFLEGKIEAGESCVKCIVREYRNVEGDTRDGS